jgi:hypothetical protein
MGALTPLCVVVMSGSILVFGLWCVARAFALCRMAFDRDADLKLELKIRSIFVVRLHAKPAQRLPGDDGDPQVQDS